MPVLFFVSFYKAPNVQGSALGLSRVYICLEELKAQCVDPVLLMRTLRGRVSGVGFSGSFRK